MLPWDNFDVHAGDAAERSLYLNIELNYLFIPKSSNTKIT